MQQNLPSTDTHPIQIVSTGRLVRAWRDFAMFANDRAIARTVAEGSETMQGLTLSEQ